MIHKISNIYKYHIQQIDDVTRQDTVSFNTGFKYQLMLFNFQLNYTAIIPLMYIKKPVQSDHSYTNGISSFNILLTMT